MKNVNKNGKMLFSANPIMGKRSAGFETKIDMSEIK